MITFRRDQDPVQPWPTKRKHLARAIATGELVTALDDQSFVEPVIPDDEPVLLITATDPLGAIVADFYADQIMARGGEKELVDAVLAHAQRMREYRDQHGSDNAVVTTVDKGWLGHG